MKRQSSKKRKSPSSLLADLKLPYSYGLLRQYKLVEDNAPAMKVMRTFWKVAKYPPVAKLRGNGFPIEHILRQMSARSLSALRKHVGVR
jgi:hypothetical protein